MAEERGEKKTVVSCWILTSCQPRWVTSGREKEKKKKGGGGERERVGLDNN